ncbi:hypothetical protein, partial [Bradyrhizobium sp. 153]|uniref:hypothetical protein n=1 Tax=Bradyrhizobium sp. 153 TaxID=2782627 RepID=UPI001FFB4568
FAVQSHLKPPSNPEASSHSYPDPEPRAPAKRLRFFEAQPFGVNERPHRPHVCLDPASSQFLRIHSA